MAPQNVKACSFYGSCDKVCGPMRVCWTVDSDSYHMSIPAAHGNSRELAAYMAPAGLLDQLHNIATMGDSLAEAKVMGDNEAVLRQAAGDGMPLTNPKLVAFQKQVTGSLEILSAYGVNVNLAAVDAGHNPAALSAQDETMKKYYYEQQEAAGA